MAYTNLRIDHAALKDTIWFNLEGFDPNNPASEFLGGPGNRGWTYYELQYIQTNNIPAVYMDALHPWGGATPPVLPPLQ
jgi:hypothetical protein